MMSIVKPWIVCCAALMLLAACDNPEQPSVEQPQTARVKVAAEKGSAASGVTKEAAGPEALLIPSPLRSVDAAQVRVSGCSDTVRYVWEVNGSRIDGATSARLATEHFQRDDEVTVAVTCNGIETRASARVSNSPPHVLSVAFRNLDVISGQEIELVPEAFDPEGDDIEFTARWQINGEVIDYVDGLVLPGDYVLKGHAITVFVTPSDSFDEGPVYRSLSFDVPDGVPHFVTTPPNEFTSLEYSYFAEAEDPDGDLLTYRLEEGPPGMTIDQATGEVNWQIEPGTSGEFQIRIIAEDPGGSYTEQSFALTLSLQE